MTLPVRVRRAAARRGADAEEDLFLGIWKTTPGFEYPGAVFPL